MKVIACYSKKGGVGKTAAAVNLSCAQAANGKRTLLCDLDPQGASSFCFRVKPFKKLTETRFFEDVAKFTQAIRGSDYDNLDIRPANQSFRDFDVFLSRICDPRPRLKKALKAVASDYDILVFDCPPSISTLSENVFHAADCEPRASHPDDPFAAQLRTARRFFQRERAAPEETQRVLLHGARGQESPYRDHGSDELRLRKIHLESTHPVCVGCRTHVPGDPQEASV